MKKINDAEYYSTGEVYQLFGITKSTLIRWRRRYHIKYVAIGRRVLYPVSEINRVIKAATTYDGRPVAPSHTHTQTHKQTNKQTKDMEKKAQTTELTFNKPTNLVITDPCYFVPDDKWASTQYGENLPFEHITQRTGIGDWSCNVVKSNGGVIGRFAADTGQCTIAALQDIQAYNADAFKGIAPGCVCVIKGFYGTISTCYGADGELRITGIGNINFTNKVMWDMI